MSRELAVMRCMAWQRAKGELNSMLATFYDDRKHYEKLKSHIEDFIEEAESEGLSE